MPEVYEDNYKLLGCFLMCTSQVRTGFSNIVGLDWNVVENVARSLHIPVDDTFYMKLQVFESVFVEEKNAKSQ